VPKGSDAKIYSQEYDDDNAADIEDADKVEDEEQDNSGSQVRRVPSSHKKGLYKEDIGNSSQTAVGN
jgi:hypothetical protein